ncbi:sugar phosphate isomerase/epimerase [Erysipelotrichaceae bacterium OttesenSCG-928-M19]|nr:sugar phosphate isomerase/epimerase [Erysipelotrichaceae bacterium OttesenSCG-928-M19]
MKVYISQLVDDNLINKLQKQYNIGVELIDFSIADNLDNPSKYLANNYYNNESPLALHGPYFDLSPATFDSLIYQATMTRFNQVYAAAQKIKANHIIFHSGYLKNIYFYESWLTNSIIFWNDFLKDKDDSIQIYIENVFEDEYKYLLELVKIINKPYFNICLDLGHANIRSKYNLVDWLTNLAPYLKHLHLHNNNGQIDSHNGLLYGSINYDEVFNLINKLKINPTLTLEINNDKQLIESLQYLEKSNFTK